MLLMLFFVDSEKNKIHTQFLSYSVRRFVVESHSVRCCATGVLFTFGVQLFFFFTFVFALSKTMFFVFCFSVLCVSPYTDFDCFTTITFDISWWCYSSLNDRSLLHLFLFSLCFALHMPVQFIHWDFIGSRNQSMCVCMLAFFNRINFSRLHGAFIRTVCFFWADWLPKPKALTLSLLEKKIRGNLFFSCFFVIFRSSFIFSFTEPKQIVWFYHLFAHSLGDNRGEKKTNSLNVQHALLNTIRSVFDIKIWWVVFLR